MLKVDLVRIFLASPGDVATERQYVREVANDANITFGAQHGIRFEVVGWDTHTYPVIDTAYDPQSLIFDQIDMSHFDLFVGIMWKRFGIPTANAGSGTEEEYRKAFASLKKNQHPDIMFYFCQMPEDLKSDEKEQADKVNKLKKELQKLGLTKDYTDTSDFRRKFNVDLALWLERYQEKHPLAHTSAAAVQDIVKGAVNQYELFHLRHLAREGPYQVRFRASFAKELRHLRELKLIQQKDPKKGVSSLPKEHHFDLKQFFGITDQGKKLLERREGS